MEIITGQIVEYNTYHNHLAELKKANDKAVFDYESKAGQEAAKKHIGLLNKSRIAVEKTRKKIKADVLKRSRAIDGEANIIKDAITAMIDVHQKPLDEITKREAERKAGIETYIKGIEIYEQEAESSFPSERIKEAYEKLSSFDISLLQEREEEGGELQQSILQKLATALDVATNRELAEAEAERLRIAQQAEIDRLNKEAAERAAQEAAAQEERDRIANEERLQREADERARKAADEAAQAKIREAEAAQRKAEEEAARVKREAEAADAKRIADAKAQADADTKRVTDIEHRKKINNAILVSIMETGITEQQGKDIIKLIASGLVANLKITY
jgi:colicin import membrane protein